MNLRTSTLVVGPKYLTFKRDSSGLLMWGLRHINEGSYHFKATSCGSTYSMQFDIPTVFEYTPAVIITTNELTS